MARRCHLHLRALKVFSIFPSSAEKPPDNYRYFLRMSTRPFMDLISGDSGGDVKNSKRRSSALGLRDLAGSLEGQQQEIDNFLRALSSYPEYFALDTTLTFEQHLHRAGNVARTPRKDAPCRVSKARLPVGQWPS
jgi:hypothetical protein